MLDAPVEVGMQRIAGRPTDHFEQEAPPFFERIRKFYLRLAKEHTERVITIDANRPREDVERDLKRYLCQFLEAIPLRDG